MFYIICINSLDGLFLMSSSLLNVLNKYISSLMFIVQNIIYRYLSKLKIIIILILMYNTFFFAGKIIISTI